MIERIAILYKPIAVGAKNLFEENLIRKLEKLVS
jgi:hypothetical protein